jgi:hypothetical protein
MMTGKMTLALPSMELPRICALAVWRGDGAPSSGAERQPFTDA